MGVRFGVSGATCSLCMIVRDEVDVLAEALASVRECVDEIVVVDTGSVDGTETMAREMGARVVRRAWRDDFSLARNESLDLARGDWALVLDADERVDAASVDEIRRLIAGPTDFAHAFEQHTYLDHDRAAGLRSCARAPLAYRQWTGYVLAKQTRLFPRRPDLRYRGEVHEELTTDLDRLGLERREASIVIHHLGKVRGAARSAAKSDLYHRLSQSKVARDGSAQSQFEAGIALMEIGEFEGAREAFDRAVDRAGSMAQRAQSMAASSRALCALGRFDDALANLRAQLPEVATVLPVWEALADTLRRSGRHDVAVQVLAQALPLFPEELQLWWMLAEAYTHLRQPELALRALDRWRDLGGRSPASDELRRRNVGLRISPATVGA